MDYKSKNYQAWKINSKDFPYSKNIGQQISFICGYGVLAPSMHNTQPWITEINGNKLTVAPDTSRHLPVGDKDEFGVGIAIGSFTENVIQAAKSFGYDVSSKMENGTAEVVFSGKPNKHPDTKSLDNITRRCSRKMPYNGKAVPKKTIKDLESLGDQEIKVDIVTKGPQFDQIVGNHLRAANEAAANEAFGRELAKWLRPNKTKDSYGMPGFVMGQTNKQAAIGKTLINKKPEILKKMVPKDELLLKSSPLILVVSASGTLDKNKLVRVGAINERIWLKLSELGLSAHPMYASIQSPSARKELGKILDNSSKPCFLMRIGFADNKEIMHTPRAKIAGDLHTSVNNLTSTLKLKPISEKVKVGKYTINYLTVGEGKPLLLIHGANIGWPQWHLNLDALASHFKVYAIDLPGAGESTKVEFSKTDFEKDYLNIVDQFIKSLGLKKLHIVGSSFGGWIAMRLAIEHKSYVDKLVVTNPIGFTRHMPMKFRPVSITPLAKIMSKTALRPERNNKNLEKFMRDVFYKKDIPLSNEFVDYFYELSKTSHNVLFISRLAHYSGMREDLFLGNMLSSIKVPTLIIWGKQDPLMPYPTVEDNFKKVKGAQVTILEDVGHMPPVESPDKFNKEVINFLLK